MSSEAAQKAFPEEPIADGVMRVSRESQRAAFDRGAVEALRQAAAYANQMHAEQGGIGEARIRADWLRKFADDWEMR